MTLYHFINIEYKTEFNEAILFLWGRNTETLEKKMFRVLGFKPRFYVPESEEVPQSSAITSIKSGYKSIHGEPFKQLTTQIPSDIPKLRQYFTKTCQSDIPFTRTFLIESGILTKFEAPDKEEVQYTEIIGS
jgi:DNA polymerase elongation subunit (family B)